MGCNIFDNCPIQTPTLKLLLNLLRKRILLNFGWFSGLSPLLTGKKDKKAKCSKTLGGGVWGAEIEGDLGPRPFRTSHLREEGRGTRNGYKASKGSKGISGL